ncbi:hypothetical protein AVEN_254097-1 [Araneus ventricosus]|uniref:Uncharacterized protein n=1 Tax=Araneus ventricosus TaxID=182803 RepID=A0A4Y2BZ12_ARAVE|nr:hypothetical protein AVEN_254097-1 [Araneus ventricosus]
MGDSKQRNRIIVRFLSKATPLSIKRPVWASEKILVSRRGINAGTSRNRDQVQGTDGMGNVCLNRSGHFWSAHKSCIDSFLLAYLVLAAHPLRQVIHGSATLCRSILYGSLRFLLHLLLPLPIPSSSRAREPRPFPTCLHQSHFSIHDPVAQMGRLDIQNG